MSLPTNTLAFIGLANEFCQSLETARETTREEFVDTMLRLLPRLYISATDLSLDPLVEEYDEPYLESLLDEDYYESVRRNIENLMGPDDLYLEVFEDDMKYSDTPIAVSIAEGLCDMFQVLYNFIGMIKDAPEEYITPAIIAVKSEFGAYWSRPLCNLLRALNHLKYNSEEEKE
ncbi:MAG: DUF5063 domain-containing protein [Duncaniella sp.]|nr:DUF5063 domain-containing protein [Duncaniella sp.]